MYSEVLALAMFSPYTGTNAGTGNILGVLAVRFILDSGDILTSIERSSRWVVDLVLVLAKGYGSVSPMMSRRW